MKQSTDNIHPVALGSITVQTMHNGDRVYFAALATRDSYGTVKYKNVLHRLDGPAIEKVDGNHSWYIGGAEYSFKGWMSLAKPKMPTEVLTMMLLKYGE